MKTLIVYYTPRGERSKTKMLVDAFREAVAGKTEIVEHDLGERPPEMFLNDNLMAYVMRDMVGESKPEYDELLTSLDEQVAELKSVDNVVLAFPVYNYSVPAVVKAWFDGIVVSGKTFSMDGGKFVGLMKGKALILSTAGGAGYESGKVPDMARPLAIKTFEFLGYDVTNIQADGANQFDEETYAGVMETKKQEIVELVNQWY